MLCTEDGEGVAKLPEGEEEDHPDEESNDSVVVKVNKQDFFIFQGGGIEIIERMI